MEVKLGWRGFVEYGLEPTLLSTRVDRSEACPGRLTVEPLAVPIGRCGSAPAVPDPGWSRALFRARGGSSPSNRGPREGLGEERHGQPRCLLQSLGT